MRRVMTTTSRKQLLRSAALLAAMAGALLVGGCGGFDGVELQGSMFDALGVSPSAIAQNKQGEPKVAARPGLVLPPDATRLPAPADKGQLAAAPDQAWPIDPEENKARASAARDQQQKDYCEKALQNARIKQETGVVMGPYGNCAPGLFGSLSGAFQGERPK